jgi:myo-inositol-1(or 4)-monophosphatase
LAGEVLLARFGGPVGHVERKSSATDLVSDADREAEGVIASLLRNERPDDALLGEEGAEASGGSGRRWLVDPLDGTTNYLYGVPQWCVSVALEGEVGVVHDPIREETFRALKGGGCELNGRPASVRPHDRLETALIATGFAYDPSLRAAQADLLRRVLSRVRDVRRAGSAALDLAWLAAGRLDGYYERGLKPWDWAAGRLLVAEAGGLLADMSGEPAGLVAAGPALLEPLLGLLEQ